MLIDTHCHINMMIKKEFDVPLSQAQLPLAQTIIQEALLEDVSLIINVGTRRIENENCLLLAQQFTNVFATVGIHPNDADEWHDDIKAMKKSLSNKQKRSEEHTSELQSPCNLV